MSAPGRFWSAVCDVFTGVPAEPEPARPPAMPTPAPADGDDGFATRLMRRPAPLLAACLVTVLGPAMAQAGALGRGSDRRVPSAERPSPGGPPPVPVPGDPASWFPLARQAAATCPGLPSSVLVAIGHLESSLNLQPGPSSAGAIGPMQFLPSTWAAYGADGDGDGLYDVMNPVDAFYGAARLLCANGGADPARLHAAIWNYNHSDDYVRHVMSLARFIHVDS